MKKVGKKVTAMLLSVMVGAAAFTGCSNTQPAANTAQSKAGTTNTASASGEKVTLTYWHTHSDGEEKILKTKLIPKFESENPNIKIKAVRMPYDGLKQQLITSISSGTAPDVMRMDIIWTPEFAKMGALVDMSSMKGFDGMKDGFFTGPLSTNFYNGKYYGLPYDTNTKLGYYSKDMLKKLGLTALPKTYDEVVALKSKLAKDEYLIGCDGSNTWSIAPYFYSLGGTYTNADFTKASGYFNSDASVKAIETISGWYDQHIMSPAMLGGKPDKSNGLFKGKVLFADDGPWFATINKKADVDKTQSGLLPSGSAGSISVVGGENLVMFKSGKHNDASWKFMQFLTGDYAQETMATDAGLVPTVKKIANSDKIMAIDSMKICVQQLDKAVARTPSPNWEKMSDKIGKCFESIIRHKAKAKEAMDKLAPEIDQLLAAK